MEEIKSCLICLIVLHALLSRTADATITVVSSVINDSAFFNCSTTSDNVEWFFGSDLYERSYIYSYETVTSQYRNRFRMENYTNGVVNQFNLILQPVTKDDAGSYTCSRSEPDSKAEKEVLLIVLETGPTCEEYWNAEGVIGPNNCGIEPETVQLSCSIRYIGSKAPTLTWVKVGEYIPIKPPFSECSDSGHTCTCNLTMKSDLLLDGFSYICQTTGPTTKQYSCTSKAIKIIYATADYSEINATVNDKVSCSVNSSQTCNYLWKSNFSEEPVFYGQYIDPTSSGSYTCEAICPVRDKNCTVTVKKVSVSAQDDIDARGSLAAIVVPTVLLAMGLILIIVCVVSCRKRRKRMKIKRGPPSLPGESIQINGQPLLKMPSSGTEQAEATPLIPVGVEINVIPEADGAGKSDNTSLNSNSDIQVIKACQGRIRGLTLLDNELYITIAGQRAVEVFDSKSMLLKKKLIFKSLADPGTMASCTINNCIYIIDKKTDHDKQEIFKYCPPAEVASKWLAGFDGRLSVTKTKGEVILAAYNQGEKSRLKIYSISKEGVLLRTIEFSKKSGISYLWHAVELRPDVFVVSHGCIHEVSHLHRVCIVRGDGDTIEKSMGKERGLGKNQVNEATCLAITATGAILVTDMKNHRVLLLSKELELKKVLFENVDHFLEMMHFDEKNGQLFIGSMLEQNSDGRVFCLPCTVTVGLQ